MCNDPPDYREIMASFAAYVQEERPKLTSPGAVARLMRPLFAGKEQEELHVLLLDSKNRLVADEIVTVGLVDRTCMHAREVYRVAIRGGANQVILVHNHPSGDPEPSVADRETTRALAAAGELLGIELLDHIIIGERTPARPDDFVSLRDRGVFL